MTAAARREHLRSIGEVISLLKGEFPDISPSKIRFLETEGLIKPIRTSSGYRKFSEAHIGRLRCVLVMQRDQYLPLKVIRDRVADLDAGRITEAELLARPSAARTDASVVELHPGRERADDTTVAESMPDLPCDREELLRTSGLSRAALAALEDYAMVVALPSGRYDAEAVTVARAAAHLAAFGLEPRHIRGFKYAADREVGTLRNALVTLRHTNTPEAQMQAKAATHDLLDTFSALREALLRVALRSG